jgi:uncharacterized RDD family membrane protein YckC
MENQNNDQQKYLNMMPDYSEINPYEYRIGFGKRLLAYIIDLLIVSIIFAIILMTTDKLDTLISAANNILSDLEGYTQEVMGIMPIYILFSLVYYSLEGFIGATVGKLLIGIRIANDDRTHASLSKMLSRFAFKNIGIIFSLLTLITSISLFENIGTFLGLIIFVGCFFVLSSKKQAFHDSLAKTAVFYSDEIINNK